MILTLANVFYVLVAVAMIALILFQRGSGASAGAGFGAGASATVFGARGASNFLSKSTAILAILFFILSLGMAMYASRMSGGTAAPEQDLGVMEELAVPGAAGEPADATVPVLAPAPATDVPAVPAAPAADVPAGDASTSGADAAGAAPESDTPPVPAQDEGSNGD